MKVSESVTKMYIWISGWKRLKYSPATGAIPKEYPPAAPFSRSITISPPSIFPNSRQASDTGTATSDTMRIGNITGDGEASPFILPERRLFFIPYQLMRKNVIRLIAKVTVMSEVGARSPKSSAQAHPS